jgi:hypothetical protein
VNVCFWHIAAFAALQNLSAIGVTADMPNGFREVKAQSVRLPFCLVLTAYGIAGKKLKC